MSSIRKVSHGFTLLEFVMVMMIAGILSVLTLQIVSNSSNEARFEQTLSRMRAIQNAMIGNPEIREGGLRTSFGYLGDIGAIPSAAQGIEALLAQPTPALPAFGINGAARFGLGWNGPYLSTSSSGTEYLEDAWGRAFIYSPAANPPTLVSLGADGVVGGTGFDQDITFTMSNELRTATVMGFICDKGGPFSSDAEVELNYPDGAGVLTQSIDTLVAADAGYFSFSNISLGLRSITAYIPSKAAATTTVGPILITIDKANYEVPCNQLDIDP